MERNDAWRIFDILSFRHEDTKTIVENISAIFSPELIKKCLYQNHNLAFMSLNVFPTRDENVAGILKYLIQSGIPINCEKVETDGTVTTLITEAMICGHITTLKMLLKLGATNVGNIDPSWFDLDGIHPVFNKESLRRSHICLSILYNLGYANDEMLVAFPDNIKQFLKDRKNRYIASVCLLRMAKITRNTIIDKNLLFGIAKNIWENRMVLN